MWPSKALLKDQNVSEFLFKLTLLYSGKRNSKRFGDIFSVSFKIFLTVDTDKMYYK